MSKFTVGQTVYAVKTSKEKHDWDFDDTKDSLMYDFADKGAKGKVVRIDEAGDYYVEVTGGATSDIFIYSETELNTVPRGAKVVKFAPVKFLICWAQPVDKPAKTLYAVVKNGKPIYSSTNRDDAREVKALHGGLKAGVTILTYKATKEIR